MRTYKSYRSYKSYKTNKTYKTNRTKTGLICCYCLFGLD